MRNISLIPLVAFAAASAIDADDSIKPARISPSVVKFLNNHAAVNTTLIELYWSIGEYITNKIDADGWGKGTVEQLAQHIEQREPDARGFSARNLWRMKQVFRDLSGSANSVTTGDRITVDAQSVDHEPV